MDLAALLAPHVSAILPLLLGDDTITEIMVNGPGRDVYIEQNGAMRLLPDVRLTADDLTATLDILAAHMRRAIPIENHLDGHLPDGSRVSAILPPCAPDGPLLSIRKHPARAWTILDLVDAGMLSFDHASWLSEQVHQRKTVVLAGPVGSGKTTMINALAHAIPLTERIAVIETAREIKLPHANVLQVEARPDGPAPVTLATLLTRILRMCPTRIIVGEVRDSADAIAFIAAVTTGHPGSFTTLHANDAVGALRRLTSLIQGAGGWYSEAAARDAVASAIHVIVHLDHVGPERTRVVRTISTVHGYTDRGWDVTPLAGSDHAIG